MIKISLSEARSVDGGKVYQCKVCAKNDYNWTTRHWWSAVNHAWSWHPGETLAFWVKW